MPVSDALRGMDREEKLEHILDAVVACLARYGFAGTTMDLIAEEAGVSKGTLTYYFKNKEDIIVRVASHVANKFHGEVRQSLEGLTDPRERLMRVIDQFWAGYAGRPELISGYYDLWSQSFFYPALKEEVLRIYTDFRKLFLDELSKLSRNEHGNPERLLIDTVLIAAVFDGVAMQFRTEPQLVDWGKVLTRLKRIVSVMLDSA